MQITDRIINDFEKMSEIKLKELHHGAFVTVKLAKHITKGVVTKAPYFIVDHIAGAHQTIETACGVWWMEVDKVRYSLEDFNVIKNNYNDHSITPFDFERGGKKKALIAKANELLEQAKNI